MWSCESTPRTFPHAYRRPPGGVAMRSPRPASAVDRDFAVGERLDCVQRDEQEDRATRGPPAGEELRRVSRCPRPPPPPPPPSPRVKPRGDAGGGSAPGGPRLK